MVTVPDDACGLLSAMNIRKLQHIPGEDMLKVHFFLNEPNGKP